MYTYDHANTIKFANMQIIRWNVWYVNCAYNSYTCKNTLWHRIGYGSVLTHSIMNVKHVCKKLELHMSSSSGSMGAPRVLKQKSKLSSSSRVCAKFAPNISATLWANLFRTAIVLAQSVTMCTSWSWYMAEHCVH